jgi:CheY-like chemotaxis protein
MNKNQIGKRILIVDDDQFVLNSLGSLLKSWQFEIAQATNGTEAFQRLEKDKLSAILLDIKLGDEDGLELLKQIRKTNKAIPVIVMTAYSKEYNRNHFFDQNAVAFLNKPILPSTLKEVLETYITK